MQKPLSKRGLYSSIWRAPIGWLGLVAGNQGLVEVVLEPDLHEVIRRIESTHGAADHRNDDLLERARDQLGEYFQGQRRAFELTLDFSGLPSFYRKVLKTLLKVPFGISVTYGELARLAGHPRAARAVGQAMATNPFPIIIPCHRVIGARGKMTGYSGGEGIVSKKWLLAFEGRMAKVSG